MEEEHHDPFAPFPITGKRDEDESNLVGMINGMGEGTRDPSAPAKVSDLTRVSFLANVAALLGWYLKDINWVGFYIVEGDTLYLGPFKGLPACTIIRKGKGVCGKSFADVQTIRVDDVHQFPGHIACDSASNSELVVPVVKKNEIVAVLDIDSPNLSRFSELDQILCEKICKIVADYW